FEIFHQQVAEFLLRGVPAALPAFHNAGAECNWIYFLTHYRTSVPKRGASSAAKCFVYSNSTEICAMRLRIINAMPRARGRTRLNIGPPSIRQSFTTRLPTFVAR